MRYVIVVFLLSNIMWSQNLDSHQWKERVIVIAADDNNSNHAESQFNLLKAEREKLIDRNIVIYKFISKSGVFYDGEQILKTPNNNIKIVGFSFVLFGLDGGEKYKSDKIEKPNVFFDLIDKMPMRRQELRNKANEND